MVGMRKLDSVLHDKLAMLIQSMGYEFVGGEMFRQGGQMVLRLYIDREGGVTVDDCSTVSRQVGAMLDVDDPVEGRYLLEVSSPGIDRPLFDLSQFQRFIGKQVKLKLNMPVMQRRQYKGTLLKVEGENIFITDDAGQEICLPFSVIEKANLVGEIRF